MKNINISVPIGTIGLVFIILKLAGVIDWSWWLVTLPIWGGFALFISFVLIFVLFVVLINIFKDDK